MKKFILSLLIIFTLANCDNAEVEKNPPKAKRKEIAVMTYNVHNVFDTVCDSFGEYDCKPGSYEKVPTPEEYDKKIKKVAGDIEDLGADIFLLQEIEKEAGLVDIIAQTKNYQAYVFGEINRPASVDVAILVRKGGSIVESDKHRDAHLIEQADGSIKRLSRELLSARIKFEDYPDIVVFTTHFVSKATDLPGIRRTREARTVKKILDDYAAKHPDDLIVFGGDLNDTPDSETLQILVDEHWINAVFDIKDLKERQTWKEHTLDQLIYRNGKNFRFLTNTAYTKCGGSPGSGYGTSDHCAFGAFFGPLP